MFSYVRELLYRHRRKFYFCGIAVGGVALLNKFASNRFLAWQDEHANQLLKQQKRKHHYEKTLQTTQITLQQLMPNIRKILERELDSDVLLQAIRDQPHRKRELWDQLKILGFGRAVCTIVCGALAAPAAHVMTMILAANTVDNDQHHDAAHAKSTLTVEVQTNYLLCLQGLIEERLPVLVARIMDIVSNALSSLPLTRKLTLPQLESILQQIVLSVANNKCSNVKTDSQAISILPWSQYLVEPENSLSQPESSERLRKMYDITVDLFNTDDFNEVVNTLVQVGLNYVLDEIALYYFNNSVPDTLNKCNISVDIKNNKAITSAEAVEIVNNDATDAEKETNNCSELSEHVIPVSTEPAGPVSVLVVKLVPLLNGLLHRALPDTDRQQQHQAAYYNRVHVCAQLEALAFNVYDTLVLTDHNIE